MTIDMEIDTDAERARCPSCNAANVFLTHSVQNMDSRRHVECRICSMCGPIELSDANAIKAWNDLPRRPTPDRTNADAERVSYVVARLRAERDEAQSLVTAWQSVFEGIEAHLMDRVNMDDEASPKTYLEIIRSDVARVIVTSKQIVAARWADYARQQAIIEAQSKALAEAREALKPFAEFVPDFFDDGYQDDDIVSITSHHGGIDLTLMVGDFRLALAVINAEVDK